MAVVLPLAANQLHNRSVFIEPTAGHDPPIVTGGLSGVVCIYPNTTIWCGGGAWWPWHGRQLSRETMRYHIMFLLFFES